jgi:hypothetical protein
VTNPIADFPASANQPEAYYANWVINNGEPIKYESHCCGPNDCQHYRINIKQWGGITTDYAMIFDPFPELQFYTGEEWLVPCDPPQDGVLAAFDGQLGAGNDSPPGKYQVLYALGHMADDPYSQLLQNISFTVVEFTIVE